MPVEYVELPSRGRVFRGTRRARLGDVDHAGEVRLEALGRFLQDVATDDADDAGLSDRRGVWVLRSTDLEVARAPVFQEPIELTTFCSGTGPRWAERRTRITGAQGARVEAAGLWVFVDREQGRPLALDEDFVERYGESAAGRRVRGPLLHGSPPAEADRRTWPLRASDYDILDHVNNARSLEAVEDELVARLPDRPLVRMRIEYRGTIERDQHVELAAEVRPPAPAHAGGHASEAGQGEAELAVWLTVDGTVRVSATVIVGRRRDRGG